MVITKDKDISTIGIILALIIGVSFLLYRNLQHPYLAFDEAVQFWISKGLNPDSNPLSMTGDISDVVEYNHFYNMDPGGFSLLLYYWSKISNHHQWLRILPFLFFLGTLVALYILSTKLHKNHFAAILSGLSPLPILMFLRTGFELRAYSMELMAVPLGLLAINQLKNRVSLFALLSWSIAIGITLSSRYSAIVFMFVICFQIVATILVSKNNFTAVQNVSKQAYQAL